MTTLKIWIRYIFVVSPSSTVFKRRDHRALCQPASCADEHHKLNTYRSIPITCWRHFGYWIVENLQICRSSFNPTPPLCHYLKTLSSKYAIFIFIWKLTSRILKTAARGAKTGQRYLVEADGGGSRRKITRDLLTSDCSIARNQVSISSRSFARWRCYSPFSSFWYFLIRDDGVDHQTATSA